MPAPEVFKLAADLSKASASSVAPLRKVWAEIGEETARRWADNARATSGVHGKHYPDSIDSELKFSANLSVEVGPNSAKKQGVMGRGFEFGSVNQPPHLDGVKAVDTMIPVAEVAAQTAVSRVIP